MHWFNRRPPTSDRHPTFRPELEALEERAVPTAAMAFADLRNVFVDLSHNNLIQARSDLLRAFFDFFAPAAAQAASPPPVISPPLTSAPPSPVPVPQPTILAGSFTAKLFNRTTPTLTFVGTFTFNVNVFVIQGSQVGQITEIDNADISVAGGPVQDLWHNGSGVLNPTIPSVVGAQKASILGNGFVDDIDVTATTNGAALVIQSGHVSSGPYITEP
jgi:hypothetical protein